MATSSSSNSPNRKDGFDLLQPQSITRESPSDLSDKKPSNTGSADQGRLQHNSNLREGLEHLFGKRGVPNPRLALPLIRLASEDGDPRAMYYYARFYQYGYGSLKIDKKQAHRLIARAASANYVPAIWELGDSATRTKILPKLGAAPYEGDSAALLILAASQRDGTATVQLIRRSTDTGDPVAYLRRGELLLEGKEVPEDRPEAIRCYLRAADAKCAEAQFRLGQMYELALLKLDLGRVVEEVRHRLIAEYLGIDTSEAARMAGLTWSAERQDHLGAIYSLAIDEKRQYKSGEFPTRAVERFRRGAELADARCMYALGEIYESESTKVGRFGGYDRAMHDSAIRYYRDAARLGDERAKGRLRQLKIGP
jgi:TPR repeat protein